MVRRHVEDSRGANFANLRYYPIYTIFARLDTTLLTASASKREQEEVKVTQCSKLASEQARKRAS